MEADAAREFAAAMEGLGLDLEDLGASYTSYPTRDARQYRDHAVNQQLRAEQYATAARLFASLSNALTDCSNYHSGLSVVSRENTLKNLQRAWTDLRRFGKTVK